MKSDGFLVIKEVYSQKESWPITIAASIFIGFLMFYFTDINLILGNMGVFYAYSQIILQVLISVLFGLNLSLLWHKLKFSSEFASKEAHTTTFASIISLLVSGCPACGITLASYLGMASFFSALPLAGLELKIIGAALLAYSTISLVNNMYVCRVDNKKEKA